MGEVCSQGTCASSCGGGTTKCGSECVDNKSDPRNCGMCGKACAANEVCMAGACATSCAMPTTKCGMACVNTQTDLTNCGMCGNLCKSGETCTSGMCQISCQQGLTKCAPNLGDGGAPDGGFTGDFCANLQTDNLNCGGCGTVCAGSAKCVAGLCANQLTVEIFPPTGTLMDPGGASVWSARYYTMTFQQQTTIVRIGWRANIAANDTMRGEIWDPANMQKLATGSTVNGSGALTFYYSDINLTLQGNKAYLVGLFMSNANTVFPRKDAPSYPFTVNGLNGNITVSACWSTNSATTDIFPTSSNVWGPNLRLFLQ